MIVEPEYWKDDKEYIMSEMLWNLEGIPLSFWLPLAHTMTHYILWFEGTLRLPNLSCVMSVVM